MKKFIKLSLLVLALVLMASCASKTSEGSFKAGTYTVKKEGFNKAEPFELEVVISEDKEITAINVLKQAETEGLGEEALKILTKRIVETQSLDHDAVASATVTSNAILEAVKEALQMAGLKPSDLKAKETSTTTEVKNYEVDVVVIGAGGAGMAAAIEANANGAKVLVLEKTELAGGNTIKATGGMNAAKTEYQDKNEFTEANAQAIQKTITTAKEKYPDLLPLVEVVEKQFADYQANPTGYFDSEELFILDTMVGGKGINDYELVKTLVSNTPGSIEWLKAKDMILDSVGAFGGASVKRIHRPMVDGKTVSVGEYLVPRLKEQLEKLGIEVLYSTPATELIVDGGKVVGVKSEGKAEVKAKAVIIATGGFGANLEKVVELKPDLKGFVTTNTPGATGDGIEMAVKVGAATVDMDQIQIHPTVEQSTSSLITEGVRGDGAILVNQEGKRFVNEVGTRDVVSAAEIAQTGGYAYLIFDQAMADASGPLTGYIKKGFTTKGETYAELAKSLGIDEKTFEETMAKWNKAVVDQKDEEFERTAFTNTLETAPFYAIKLSPGIHHTMGGIKINTNAQVLDEKGSVIEGLYAAGEVTGGVHGANRLGGNAVADIITFGRIAGEHAAKNLK